MLGFVKQEDFDREKEGRIRAEARLESSESMLLAARDREHYLNEQLKQMRADHTDQIAKILDSLKPKEVVRPETPVGSVFEELTYEQIMAEPATGKREMEMRDKRAQAALERDRQKSQNKQNQRREELLTPDEKRAMLPDFDSTLGVFVEKEAAHANTN